VVDFRLKEHLRDMPEESAVPLVYPGHLGVQGTVWPLPGLKPAAAQPGTGRAGVVAAPTGGLKRRGAPALRHDL